MKIDKMVTLLTIILIIASSLIGCAVKNQTSSSFNSSNFTSITENLATGAITNASQLSTTTTPAATSNASDLSSSYIISNSRSSSSPDIILTGEPTMPIEIDDSYKIIVSNNATESVIFAALELQKYIGEMYDKTYQIILDNMDYTGKALYVGESKYSRNAGLTVNSQVLGDEGYLLKTVGNSLYILGGVRGALYGVYSLLEDYYGCRWFAADCTIIPSLNNFAIPNISERFVPVFEYREDWYYEYVHNNDFAVKNKINGMKQNLKGKYGGNITYAGSPNWLALGHTFRDLCPIQAFWAKNSSGNIITTNGQLCLTNPGTFTETLKNVKSWLNSYPAANIITVSQEDAYGWCECANCKAREDYYGGTHSGLILEFVNKIANAIKSDYPDVMVDTFAYSYSVAPPTNIVAADNVIVRLCSYYECNFHPYGATGCIYGQLFGQRLVSWSKICKNLYAWDYNIDFQHYLKPYPNLQVMQTNIKLFAENNVKGLLSQGHFEDENGEFAQLKSYLIAKLSWDPDCDLEAAKNEFIDAYYGAAAPDIKEYIDTIYNGYAASYANPVLRCSENPPDLTYFSNTTLTKCESILANALSSVANNATNKKRIEIVQMQIRYVRLWQARKTTSFNTLKASFASDASRLGIYKIKEGEDITTTLNALASRMN